MKQTKKPTDPLSTFSLSIFKINGLLLNSGDAMTRSIGQTSARWQVLGRAGYAPQTVAEMARDMGHARQSVQRIANVLASEGLVTYKNNPIDKRAQLLELTPRGAEILAAIYRLSEEWSKRIMAKLNPEQLIKVTAALEEIGEIIETNENNIINRQEDVS